MTQKQYLKKTTNNRKLVIMTMLVTTNLDHNHGRDDDQMHIHERVCYCNRDWDRDHDCDRDLSPTLSTTTQENKTELEGLRRENTQLKAAEEQRRIDKSKREKKRDNKVCSELLAMDAAKGKLKSKSCASKIVDQFGSQDSSAKLCASNIVDQLWPKDSSAKVVGTNPKNSQKGVSKSDSPAKRNRTEKSHPVTADYTLYKTGPPPTGAGLNAPPKMLYKQGSQSDERPLFEDSMGLDYKAQSLKDPTGWQKEDVSLAPCLGYSKTGLQNLRLDVGLAGT